MGWHGRIPYKWPYKWVSLGLKSWRFPPSVNFVNFAGCSASDFQPVRGHSRIRLVDLGPWGHFKRASHLPTNDSQRDTPRKIHMVMEPENTGRGTPSSKPSFLGFYVNLPPAREHKSKAVILPFFWRYCFSLTLLTLSIFDYTWRSFLPVLWFHTNKNAPLESRWRNSHVLVYHGPLWIHLLGVVPSTFTVYVCVYIYIC